MSRRHAPGVFGTISVFVISALVFGCNKSEESTNTKPGRQTSSGGASATSGGSGGKGEAIFASNGCGNCHTVGTKTARGGPDLSHAGAKGNSEQWLMDKIKNPQATNPRSRMPKYEGKIAEPDLKELASYIASLK